VARHGALQVKMKLLDQIYLIERGYPMGILCVAYRGSYGNGGRGIQCVGNLIELSYEQWRLFGSPAGARGWTCTRSPSPTHVLPTQIRLPSESRTLVSSRGADSIGCHSPVGMGYALPFARIF
jgi:hypothetical protein